MESSGKREIITQHIVMLVGSAVLIASPYSFQTTPQLASSLQEARSQAFSPDAFDLVIMAAGALLFLAVLASLVRSFGKKA